MTVNKSAFGAAGFGYPRIASVHASPSKTGNNTECVQVCTTPFAREVNNSSGNEADNSRIESKITLFPNPADDYLNISFIPAKSDNSNISLYDINGKLVSYIYNGMTEERKIYQKRIDTRLFKTGIYLIKFQNGDLITTKKLVIKK